MCLPAYMISKYPSLNRVKIIFLSPELIVLPLVAADLLDTSGVVGVKLLGRQPDQWRPPLSHTFFASWSGTRPRDACHVIGTTCNDRRSLRNTVGWMGVLGRI